jgi:hypothetical protein
MSEEFTNPGPSAPPPLPPFPTYRKPPKTPAVALVLSLFPGLGQVYNGQPAKAVVFFLAWVGALAGGIEHGPMPFALMLPFIHLYNLVDAWKSAVAINARAAGGQSVVEEDIAESPAWGATLVGVGVVLLLKNIGWLNVEVVARYWPLLLIAAGIAMLRGSLRKQESDRGSAL